MPTNHHTREGYEALYERLYFERLGRKPAKEVIEGLNNEQLLIRVNGMLLHFDCVLLDSQEIERELVH